MERVPLLSACAHSRSRDPSCCFDSGDLVPRRSAAFRIGVIGARSERRLPDQRRAKRSWGPAWRFVVVLLFSVVLAGWSYAAFEAAEQGWQGCSRLVEIATQRFGSARVRPTSVLNYDELTPSDAVLILAPRGPLRFAALSAFLGQGGRVAIADDFGTADGLLTRFRMRRALAPASPLRRVGTNPELPVATPVGVSGQRHPIVRELDAVYANHASALEVERGVELTPLLEIEATGGEPSALFAATGVIGRPERCGLRSASAQEACGRLVAIGDPSVFINLMLGYPDNERFARRLLDYLLEDDAWGRRGGSLFLVTGDFSQQGGALDPPGLVSEVLAALGEEVVQAWAQGLPEALSVALAVALLLTMTLWAGALAGRSHSPFRPRFAEQGGSPPSSLRAGRVAGAGNAADDSLLMLEVKRNVETALATALGASPSLGWSELARRAKKRCGGSAAGLLERLAGPLHEAERAALLGKPLHVSEETLRSYHRMVSDLNRELCATHEAPSAKRRL